MMQFKYALKKEKEGGEKEEEKRKKSTFQGIEPAKEISTVGWLQVRFNAVDHRCHTTVPISLGMVYY